METKRRLMNYRNIIHLATHKVPAELVFRRRLKTKILIRPKLLGETEIEEA